MKRRKGGNAPAPIILPPPPLPPPPPPPPTLDDPAAAEAARKAAQAIQNQSGRASTVLTGARGVTGSFPVSRSRLLALPFLSSEQDTLFARFLGQ